MRTTNMNKVFHAIEGERDYQNRKWGTVQEHPHEVGGYILLMEKILNDAKIAWATSNNDHKALSEIRKVIAVGVACGEQHGIPGRSPTQELEKMR